MHCCFLIDNYETATACYTTTVIFDRCRYCVVKTTFSSSVEKNDVIKNFNFKLILTVKTVYSLVEKRVIYDYCIL